jgi:hypothetical protein
MPTCLGPVTVQNIVVKGLDGGIKLDEPEISNREGLHLVHFLQPDRTECVTGSDMRISPPFISS